MPSADGSCYIGSIANESADLVAWVRPTSNIGPETAIANSCLMVAGPEMLAALKRFAAIMDRMNDSGQYEQLWYQLPPELLEASREAYNAIVKAESQS